MFKRANHLTVNMATGIAEVLAGDGAVHQKSEKDRSEKDSSENGKIDTNGSIPIISETSLILGGKFSAFAVEAFEGFSSDNDLEFSEDEEDIFCDDYGFLAEDDLAHEEFEHTRQAKRYNSEPCRLEDILNCLDDSRGEGEDNAGIVVEESDLGASDLQALSNEGDEKEVMAQNDRLLSRKRVQGDYGIVKYLQTGEILEGFTYSVVRRGPILVSTNRAPYAYKLYELPSSRVQDIYKKLFTLLPSVKSGDIYRFNSSSDTWFIPWEAERLAELTTFSLISVICGALNSRRRLHWCIGINRRRGIEGCVMTREDRDTVRQAFVYSMRSGIVPQLDSNLVQLKFIPVESLRNGGNTRVLVTITIDTKVSKLHQLSSGRIFYVLHNELKEVEGGMDEVSRMLNLKENHDLYMISELDPEGHHRFKLRTNSVYGLIEYALPFFLTAGIAYYLTRRIVIYP